MNRHTITMRLALGLMVAALLAACDSGAAPTAPTGSSAGTVAPTPGAGGVATTSAQAATPAPPAAGNGTPVKLTFHRFFGECSDKYKGVTDLTKGTDECSEITLLTNKWNAEHPEAPLDITVTDQGAHYTNLSAEMAAGEPPDIVIMHGAQIPNYASRGALLPLDEVLTKAGIDVSDFLPAAREYATFNGKMYALPFDIHTILWHINVDLWKQAGLVDAAGKPMIPKTQAEFLADAKAMKEKTGKLFMAAQTNGDIGGEWAVEGLVWQQGGDLFTPDVITATVNTPQVLTAVNFLGGLFKNGYTGNNDDYGAAEKKWLNGDAASLINGTWAVGAYDDQVKAGKAAFKTYYVAPFPTIFDKPAAWSNSHTWVMPVQRNPDPAKVAAAGRFLKYLYDNDLQWTRTGHLTVRKSVLQSPDYAALPHRGEYADAANIAHAMPRIRQIDAFQTIMHDEVVAANIGQKTPAQALADAEKRVTEFLKMAAP